MSGARNSAMIGAPVVGAIFSFFVIPAMSWTTSLEVVGRFNLLQLWGGLATLVFALGLDQAYMRFFHVVGSERHLWRQVLTPIGILSITLLVLAPLLASAVARWLFALPSFRVGLLVLFYCVASLSLRFVTIKARMLERGGAFLAAQSLPKVALLVVIFVCLFFGKVLSFDVLLVVALLGVSVSVLFVGFLLRGPHAGNARHSDGECVRTSEMLRFGFPLLISALAFWGISAVGPIALQHFGSLKQVGLLAVVMSFAAPAAVVPLVVGTAWVPQAFKAIGRNEEVQFVEVSVSQISQAIYLTYWAVGAGSFVVDSFVPASYPDVGYMIPAAVGPSLWYALSEVTGIGIVITKRSIMMALASVVALAVALLLNTILAGSLGALGAVVAIWCANLVMLILRTEFSNRSWHLLSRRQLYPQVFLLTVMSALSIAGKQVGSYWIVQCIWVAGVAVFVARNRRMVIRAICICLRWIRPSRPSQSVSQSL